MTEPAEPGRPGPAAGAVSPWFDHVMRAQERYNDSKGDFYAAGITYFTIFALFPLLMVGFADRRLRPGEPARNCSPRSRSKIKATVSGRPRRSSWSS